MTYQMWMALALGILLGLLMATLETKAGSAKRWQVVVLLGGVVLVGSVALQIDFIERVAVILGWAAVIAAYFVTRAIACVRRRASLHSDQEPTE